MILKCRIRSLTKSDVTYRVRYADRTWTCDCPSGRHRGLPCKHIWLLRLIGVRRIARLTRAGFRLVRP
jgi:hypothetical protein